MTEKLCRLTLPDSQDSQLKPKLMEDNFPIIPEVVKEFNFVEYYNLINLNNIYLSNQINPSINGFFGIW
jgi:hypothetical protein